MDEELERYYENRLAMFASKGWADMMDDVKVMREQTNRLDTCERGREDFKRGELSIQDWLLSLEKMSIEAYKDLKDADV